MKQVILLTIAFLFSLGLLAQEREEVRYNQYRVPVDGLWRYLSASRPCLAKMFFRV
ncbi:MAG: hypothetical protein LBI96_07700 [Odoribacteraceae bacterium]|nr:hypothetical protein [Odoribacteraceae bacterium]